MTNEVYQKEKHSDEHNRSEVNKNGGGIGGGGYHAIHGWLRKYHGKANICENHLCEGKSKIYHWALLKGKEYDYNRENFWKLCLPCHRKYDSGNKSSKAYLENSTKQKNIIHHSIYFPPALLEQLYKSAKKNYRTINNEMLYALKQYLAQQKQQ